jgi:hypothetical protein
MLVICNNHNECGKTELEACSSSAFLFMTKPDLVLSTERD